jgi:hypothetical protein
MDQLETALRAVEAAKKLHAQPPQNWGEVSEAISLEELRLMVEVLANCDLTTHDEPT